MDISHRRKTLEENGLKEKLVHIFPNHSILVSNIGYIARPNDIYNSVKKIYLFESDYLQELRNYHHLRMFNIPKIISLKNIGISEKTLPCIEFENVNIFKRFYSYQEIPGGELSGFLQKFYSVTPKRDGLYLIHGNMHVSHFYQNDRGLGFYDLYGMHYGEREYDVATIYIQTLCNDEYLESILTNFENIDIRRLHYYALEKLMHEFRLGRPIKDEGEDGLRVLIHKIKSKLGSK